MIRFFGKQNNDDKTESSDSRLRIVEWKINLILIMVGIQFIMTMLIMVKQYFIPSTTTIVLCCVVLAVAIWFFRKQLPGLIKKMLFRQLVGDETTATKAHRRETEDSIR